MDRVRVRDQWGNEYDTSAAWASLHGDHLTEIGPATGEPIAGPRPAKPKTSVRQAASKKEN